MRRLNKNRFNLDWKYLFTELVLIVLGILLAINLNTWSANRKQIKQTHLSIDKISEELKLNMEELEEVIEANENLNDFYGELNQLRTDSYRNIRCSVEQMSQLKKKFPEQFRIVDSSMQKSDEFAYEMILNFELEYGELNDIAWRTAQISNNVNEFGYNCLKDILSVYGFQDLFVEVQNKFLDYKIRKDEGEFIATFQLSYRMSEDLLARYQFLEETITTCK